ncbi:hypothetical protein PanWU01x14_196690 [Parasponia andersonii]|uniref:Uncharacterized protein n=1 Tax=Parasponia andersonii TaxID=3476 RepID=A0A2P5BZU5_PARAD|nr:hypothetical protein PanWU01x14_196690 [Parasponia andersonii]
MVLTVDLLSQVGEKCGSQSVGLSREGNIFQTLGESGSVFPRLSCSLTLSPLIFDPWIISFRWFCAVGSETRIFVPIKNYYCFW